MPNINKIVRVDPFRPHEEGGMSEPGSRPPSADFCRLDRALARLQNDRALLGEIAQIFIEDRRAIWTELQRGLQASNQEIVCRTAHTLKGLVSNFNSGPAERACLAVEEAARSGNFEEVMTLLPELVRRLDRLEGILRNEFDLRNA